MRWSMQSRCWGLAWLLLLSEVYLANGAAIPLLGKKTSVPSSVAPKLGLEGLAGHQRDQVKDVVDKATLFARGPGEAFHCKPEHYYWFLDHPDRAVQAWRRLGA